MNFSYQLQASALLSIPHHVDALADALATGKFSHIRRHITEIVGGVRVEVHRSRVTVKLVLPDQCAAGSWLRELSDEEKSVFVGVVGSEVWVDELKDVVVDDFEAVSVLLVRYAISGVTAEGRN